MTSPNGLGKRTTSAAVSAALVLSLCPMAPIQSAIAETTDEAGSVEPANASGGVFPALR